MGCDQTSALFKESEERVPAKSNATRTHIRPAPGILDAVVAPHRPSGTHPVRPVDRSAERRRTSRRPRQKVAVGSSTVTAGNAFSISRMLKRAEGDEWQGLIGTGEMHESDCGWLEPLELITVSKGAQFQTKSLGTRAQMLRCACSQGNTRSCDSKDEIQNGRGPGSVGRGRIHS
jgi:hypothetical protein